LLFLLALDVADGTDLYPDEEDDGLWKLWNGDNTRKRELLSSL